MHELEQEYDLNRYIIEAHAARSAYIAELTLDLVATVAAKVKALLQTELPAVIPGPLAHR